MPPSCNTHSEPDIAAFSSHILQPTPGALQMPVPPRLMDTAWLNLGVPG